MIRPIEPYKVGLVRCTKPYREGSIRPVKLFKNITPKWGSIRLIGSPRDLQKKKLSNRTFLYSFYWIFFTFSPSFVYLIFVFFFLSIRSCWDNTIRAYGLVVGSWSCRGDGYSRLRRERKRWMNYNFRKISFCESFLLVECLICM